LPPEATLGKRTGQGLIYKQNADISSVSANRHFITILNLKKKICGTLKNRSKKPKKILQKSSVIVVKEA
jgi:hypothetical protein